MEFGSLGLALPSQQSAALAAAAPSAGTVQGTPGTVVTPPADSAESRPDRRDDRLGRNTSDRREEPSRATAEDRPTNRRTTLNFDVEQNRVFLEVVDTATDEVVERIPSEVLVEFIARALADDADRADGSGRTVDQSV